MVCALSYCKQIFWLYKRMRGGERNEAKGIAISDRICRNFRNKASKNIVIVFASAPFLQPERAHNCALSVFCLLKAIFFLKLLYFFSPPQTSQG